VAEKPRPESFALPDFEYRQPCPSGTPFLGPYSLQYEIGTFCGAT
jgi:hypothetical protein